MTPTPSNLLDLFASRAKAYVYRRRGTLFWRARDTHLTLVQLQRSRWDDGTYFNFGILPTAMVIGGVPPSTGSWLEMRGESFEGPHRDTFIRLATHPSEEVSEDEKEAAIAWLLNWIESNLANPEPIRKALLARDDTSLIGRLAHGRVHELPDDWVWFQWARNELTGPPESYFTLPYYKKSRNRNK